MKKLLVTLAAVLVSASTFAQGTILFNNRTPTGDARVSRPDGTGAGAGITAQLFLVGAGGTLTAIPGTTTFRETPAAATFFVNPTSVSVPGVAAGTAATVRMRAWATSAGSYDAAIAGAGLAGESNDVTISQLGGTPAGGGAPIPDPGLSGLQGFTINIVPEPSTMALGLLGAAALLYRRRK
jgi:hypothetical protein